MNLTVVKGASASKILRRKMPQKFGRRNATEPLQDRPERLQL